MRPSVVLTVFVALLAASAAFAAAKDPKPQQALAKEAAGTTKASSKKLVLPNIPALLKTLEKADRDVLASQQKKSAQVLAFFNGPGEWLRATRHEKCWEVPWQRSCTIARATHRLHTQLAEVAMRRLLSELPDTDDWRTAVRIAQRAYPGTEGWLLSCSASEGGWGRWVPNSQGSGVGGWMQMYPSTFWRMWGAGTYDGATDDLARRGITWPASAASWYSPLGQALASAWGLTHGRRGEWHGSGC